METLAVLAGLMALFVALLASLALGRRVGARRHTREGLGAMTGAVFALLGLLLAFSFSGAAERFDRRRRLIVAESNAIGTAYLRVDLAAPQDQPRLRDLFRRWVDLRLAAYERLPDLSAFEAELRRAQDAQESLWAAAVAASTAPGAHVDAGKLLLPSLNIMFDVANDRRREMQIHPPVVVFALLVALGLGCACLAGYEVGASDGARSPLHAIGFAATLSITIVVILDLELPRVGLLRVDAMDRALADVRADMG